MTDDVKALIEKTKYIDGMWSKEQILRHAQRLADALAASQAPKQDEGERRALIDVIARQEAALAILARAAEYRKGKRDE